MQTRSRERKDNLSQNCTPNKKDLESSTENVSPNIKFCEKSKGDANKLNGSSSKINCKQPEKNNNFLSVDAVNKQSIYKSPTLSPQQVPENILKSPSSSKNQSNKSPSSTTKGLSSPDLLNLDENINGIKDRKLEEVKIQPGCFIQKHEGNVDEYLSHFHEKVKLGSGHYSEVFKIKNKENDNYKAMKIIKKNKIPFNEKDSFLREIQILKKLDHPNILKLYEFLEDDQNYYLITELCEGKELFDVIQDNCESLTEKDIASIIQQILQSLAYAHSNKIMHRDIKPENIMVSQDKKSNYNIKLVDWGIGSDFGTNDETLNTKCGTPYYAAPEVIKKKYNQKCDIWSTGVILYTLLVQEIPFNGDSTTDIIMNVLKGQYEMKGEDWNKVSDDARDLVKKMLCYNYENRVSAEEALQHPWFKQVLNIKQSKAVLKVNLSKLQHFKAQSQLQRAAMNFIVSHLISEKDKEQFSLTFKLLDENGDGQLSKSEIMNGYQKVWGKCISEEEVNKIFDQIDVNQSGFIDYTEFITAAIDTTVFTEQEKLKNAFNLFDKDGDGFITSKEIQNVLGVGVDLDQEAWNKMVAEVDENGDGQISFEEFKTIMEQIVKQNQAPKRKQQRKKSNMMVDERELQQFTLKPLSETI